ncbi:MAG: hypothetical protein ABFC56_09770 [Clostridiaceae bacterium]
MKPYTLEQALALPDGAEIWIEESDGHFDHAERFGDISEDDRSEYGTHWRVWPTRPTDAERAGEKWEGQE